MPCACLLLGFLTWQSLWPVTDGRTDSCRPLAAPLVLLQAGQGIVQRAKEAESSAACIQRCLLASDCPPGASTSLCCCRLQAAKEMVGLEPKK